MLGWGRSGWGFVEVSERGGAEGGNGVGGRGGWGFVGAGERGDGIGGRGGWGFIGIKLRRNVGERGDGEGGEQRAAASAAVTGPSFALLFSRL